MTETAAPEIRARRGDLVIVELRPSYTTASYAREEQPLEYRLLKVTNLFRDGRIKRVCDVRYGDESYAVPYEQLLHATGRDWLLPAADWDVDRAQELAAEHVYPGSTTPRDFPSLEAAREALAPARLGYTSPEPEVPEEAAFRVDIVRDKQPLNIRYCADKDAVQDIISGLLKDARVGMTDRDRAGVARLVTDACEMAAADGLAELELVGSRVTLRPVR